ncbi:MAG: ATP phosphoribosyltransferase regulatory subunit [Elainellaceae cyanobacterium]
MVYQPPAGARDLFPPDVAQRQWIEDRLQRVFHQWGYHRIITSTLERLDTLVAGGAVQPSSVIQLHDANNEVLGLRPELTASIARAAVTRLSGVNHAQRFCYSANVFRRLNRNSHDRQQEFFQAGVELLGIGGAMADAEVLLLLADCLNTLKLHDWHLVIGEAELTRSLFEVFPPEWRNRIRVAIAQLDRVTLENLPLAPELRDRALWLLDLRGTPADVLQRVSEIELDPRQQDIVKSLKSLMELLELTAQAHNLPMISSLVLDLSLIQTFNYYTGIVFNVVHATDRQQYVLGQGGRYDQLLGLYHPQGEACPGVGFVLNIETLQKILAPTGQMPIDSPSPHCLVVPKDANAATAAFAIAHQLRTPGKLRSPEQRQGAIESFSLDDEFEQQGLSIEINLDIQMGVDAVRQMAQGRCIPKIIWVDADGRSTLEVLQDETRQDEALQDEARQDNVMTSL